MAFDRFLCVALLYVSTAVAVTPVQKVIDLLTQLKAQIEDEGKHEAAQYDEYAKFCRMQNDEKVHYINKSAVKIEKLTVTIDDLGSQIDDLNARITVLSGNIEDFRAKIENAAEIRAQEHANYSVEEADISAAIGALRGAIDALKASKAQMEGAKLDFAQIGMVATRVLAVNAKLSQPPLAADSLSKVTALSQLADGQAPPTFAYHSNEIITTLEDLLSMFIQNKKDLDLSEFETKAAYDKKDLNLRNLKAFDEKEKREKEAFAAKLTEEKETAEADRTEETKDKEADESFLKVLHDECRTKAEHWEQRTQMRADELKAIAGAMEALQSGVAPSYGANKKLVALQKQAAKKAPQSSFAVGAAAPKKSMSFLQLRGSHSQAATVALVEKVAKALSAAASKYDSSLLAAAAIRVQSSEDHFVKVRSIIKDLVARLEADAEAEATQKSFCDKAMKNSVTSRDNAKAEIESLTATQSKLTSEKALLTEEIATLAKQIAELQTALKEATDLRNKEREENEKTIATSKEGLTSTELAIQILGDFYENAQAFVQYVPPNSDREGKTVGDRAPEIWEGTYHGKQADSKGIIGLLEVVKSDFERTITTVTDEENTAQADFEEFEQETNEEIGGKTDSKTTKEDRVTTIKDELTTTEDSLQEQNTMLDAALKALAELKVQCVDGEETYAERVAKREKEIEALKEAHAILENWQG